MITFIKKWRKRWSIVKSIKKNRKRFVPAAKTIWQMIKM